MQLASCPSEQVHHRINAKACAHLAACRPAFRRCNAFSGHAQLATGLQRCNWAASASAAAEPGIGIDPLAERQEAEAEGDYCLPPEITTDNTEHDRFSKITVEVKAYPGMFRVIAWVLNGLELDVHNAEIGTDSEGNACNHFWLTDIRGRKLTKSQLDEVADRLTDFVLYCTPDETATKSARKWSYGPVTVDNTLDDSMTVISIFAASRRHERLPRNALLEVASAVNAVGVRIKRAVIQSCSDCGVPVDEDGFTQATEAAGARLYRVWGTTRAGHKLDHARATALIYTMNREFGIGSKTGSTSVPRYELD